MHFVKANLSKRKTFLTKPKNCIYGTKARRHITPSFSRKKNKFFFNSLVKLTTKIITCFDTIKDEKTSGIEVPTARKDKPITVSGTDMVYPMTVISQVTS